MDATEVIALYVTIMETGIPIAVIFSVCDILVTTFLRAAFGGRFHVGV